MRILIETYGCTLNQADSGIIAARLREAGHEVSSGLYKGSGFDYLILNTCTVKMPTEQRILDRIGKARGMGKKLIVTGCMAGANRDLIAKAAPDAVIVSSGKMVDLPSVIERIETGKIEGLWMHSRVDKAALFRAEGDVIAKLPISEGCLSSCSFCETKFARGPLNSFPEGSIVKAASMSIKAGAKEIQLASQDTGAYGLDRKTDIAELASRISQLEGDFKVRIGMLNPEHLHRYFDRLVDTYKSEKIYKFIHLPVQAGSDRVLSEMGRNYSVEEFREYVRELRKKVNGISIETDVIVGYPTETDGDFAETLKLLEDTRPNITNISRFGRRPHASAGSLRQLRSQIVKERSIAASRVARKIQHEDMSRHVGERWHVLITERNDRSLSGRDERYRLVAFGSDKAVGDTADVEITGNTYACYIGMEIKDPMLTS